MAEGLSDHIEQFIKALLDAADAQIDLQRNELAAQFRCAPSQINYVLSTRFTADHGYRIESRRGGGGYVRIIRIDVDRVKYFKALCEKIGESIAMADALQLTLTLRRKKMLSLREMRLLTAAMEAAGDDGVRARVLRAMLEVIAREEVPYDL